MRKKMLFTRCPAASRCVCSLTVLGGLATGSLAIPDSAYAAIVTQTVEASLTPQPTGFANQQIGVQQFDPSLGTLQSVEVILQGTGQIVQQYENQSPNSSSITFGQTLNSALMLPGGQQVSIQQSENHAYSANANDHVLDFGGPAGGTHAYAVTASSQQLYTGNLSAFTGSGLAFLFLSANATFQILDLTGNLIVAGTTMAGADISVIYTYDATFVPEPRVYGITLGAAGLVFGMMRGASRRSTWLRGKCAQSI